MWCFCNCSSVNVENHLTLDYFLKFVTTPIKIGKEIEPTVQKSSLKSASLQIVVYVPSRFFNEYSGENMVVRTLRRRFGAGCVPTLFFVGLWLWQAVPVAQAGFVWTTDWKVTNETTSSNNLRGNGIADPPPTDFIQLKAQSSYLSQSPDYTYTSAEYAEREFQLSGFSEPVKVSIQTVIDAWASLDTFGVRATIHGESGIVDNMQGYQRSLIMPGTGHLSLNQTRDIYLTNGTYTFLSSLRPTITPKSVLMVSGAGYIESQMLVNITVVPEPSAIIGIGIGLTLVGLYRRRFRN